jgi:hypothetical protein
MVAGSTGCWATAVVLIVADIKFYLFPEPGAKDGGGVWKILAAVVTDELLGYPCHILRSQVSPNSIGKRHIGGGGNPTRREWGRGDRGGLVLLCLGLPRSHRNPKRNFRLSRLASRVRERFFS